jgi:O-antigen ligase
MIGHAGLRPLPWSAAVAGLAALLGTFAGFQPVLALALALGLAFVALALADLLVGLCLFTLVTFMEVLPNLGEISAAKAVGLVLVASWLATLATRREASRSFLTDHPVATYIAVLFLLWVLASALWAQDQGRVIGDLIRYAPNVLLIGIVYAAIRDRRSTVILVATFIIGAMFAAGYSVVNAAPVEAGVNAARLGGANANGLALILIGATTLAVALAMIRSQPPLARLAYAGGAMVCAYALLSTSSRMGLVGLGTVIVLAIIFAGRGRRASVFALSLVAALAVVVYMTALAPPQARDRIFKSDGGSGRTDLWKVGWRAVQDKPVHGVGAGNFSLVSVQYIIRPGAIRQPALIVDTPKVPHNIYLQVLAELGAIGLVLFLGLIGFTLCCAARAARLFAARGDPTLEIISRALFVCTAGMLTAGAFSSQLFNKPLWLLIAMAPALLAIARENRVDARAVAS